MSSRNLLLAIICMAFPHASPEVAFAAGAKNGSDFATYRTAQSNFDFLDADHNRVACEELLRAGRIDRTVDAVSDGGIGASVLIVAPLAVLGGLGVGMYGFL